MSKGQIFAQAGRQSRVTAPLTCLHGIGQSHSPTVVDDGDMKDRFQCRLIEAGEHLTGIGGLKMGCGNHSVGQERQRAT